MKRWLVIFMLVFCTCMVHMAAADDRRPGDYGHRRDYQFIPEPQRPGDQVIIRKGRKCELICTKLWDGEVRCVEYRC